MGWRSNCLLGGMKVKLFAGWEEDIMKFKLWVSSMHKGNQRKYDFIDWFLFKKCYNLQRQSRNKATWKLCKDSLSHLFISLHLPTWGCDEKIMALWSANRRRMIVFCCNSKFNRTFNESKSSGLVMISKCRGVFSNLLQNVYQIICQTFPVNRDFNLYW